LALALCASLLLFACSEGQVAPIDQSEGISETGDDDGGGDTQLDNDIPNDIIDINDTDQSDQVDLLDSDSSELDTDDDQLCINGRTRCVGSAYEVCVNGIWKPTLCNGTCQNNECVEQFPAGTCETPLTLAVPDIVRGSTDADTGFIEWSGVCGRTVGPSAPKTLGPESVYRLQLDKTSVVKFTLTPIDPKYFGLYLRTDCYALGTDLFSDCGSNKNPSSPYEQVSILSAGEYFVVVDDFGYEEGGGEFQLETEELNKNALPACHDLRPILLDLSTGQDTRTGNLSLEGSTFEYWLGTECDAYSAFDPFGPEMVYVFALRTPGSVTIEATPTNPASDRLYLYVRTECERQGSQIGCHATGGNAPSRLTLENLSAGTYYVYVDSYNQSEAPQFTLTVRLN
ncbi:MAG: hypothetical protein RBU37_24545, partial [Myxococcota bacterium]|nr:hypothetical protein [Myxococcota bacterium]